MKYDLAPGTHFLRLNSTLLHKLISRASAETESRLRRWLKCWRATSYISPEK